MCVSMAVRLGFRERRERRLFQNFRFVCMFVCIDICGFMKSRGEDAINGMCLDGGGLFKSSLLRLWCLDRIGKARELCFKWKLRV